MAYWIFGKIARLFGALWIRHRYGTSYEDAAKDIKKLWEQIAIDD